jgi:hypothetical protein
MRTYKNRMNSSALSDMNEKKECITCTNGNRWGVVLLKKTYKEPKSATRSKDYKT